MFIITITIVLNISKTNNTKYNNNIRYNFLLYVSVLTVQSNYEKVKNRTSARNSLMVGSALPLFLQEGNMGSFSTRFLNKRNKTWVERFALQPGVNWFTC